MKLHPQFVSNSSIIFVHWFSYGQIPYFSVNTLFLLQNYGLETEIRHKN